MERWIHGKRPVSEYLGRISRALLKEAADRKGWLLGPVVQFLGEEYRFCCCSSFAQSCPTLCNPMDCSQASLSFIISRSLFKLTCIESMMLSNCLILCHPLLLPPSIFPSLRVFPSESALLIRWPKYWSFSFIIGPSNEHSGLISFRIELSHLGESEWVSASGTQYEGIPCSLTFLAGSQNQKQILAIFCSPVKSHPDEMYLGKDFFSVAQ